MTCPDCKQRYADMMAYLNHDCPVGEMWGTPPSKDQEKRP